MTAKTGYKKELFSLPVEVAESLQTYADKTHRKKSHIVSEALLDYMEKHQRKVWAQEAKKLFGIINANTPEIQEIKANREDI